MLVKTIMTPHTISIAPQQSLKDAFQMMRANDFEGLPVVDGDRIIGVLTIWDLLMASCLQDGQDFLSKTPASQIMNSKIITIKEDDIIEEAAFLMRKHDINLIPVTDEFDNLTGVVTQSDLFKVFVEMMGLQSRGTRIHIQVPDKVGQLAEVASIIRRNGISIASMSTFAPRHDQMDLVVRIKTIEAKRVVDDLRRSGFRILHVSQVWE